MPGTRDPDRRGLRHRRPLLVLLVLGFVGGLLWVTRHLWTSWRRPQIAAGASPASADGDGGTAAELPAPAPPPAPVDARPEPVPPAPSAGEQVLDVRAPEERAPDDDGGERVIDLSQSEAAPGRHAAPPPPDMAAVPDLVDLVDLDRLDAEAAAEGGRHAAPPGTVDDLTRIEGVGPRMAAALREAGLTTFDAVAGVSVDELRTAISAQGLRFAPSLSTWPAQARLLADGDEAGLAALTAGLGRGAAPRPDARRD